MPGFQIFCLYRDNFRLQAWLALDILSLVPNTGNKWYYCPLMTSKNYSF